MQLKRIVAFLLCFAVGFSFLMPKGYTVSAAGDEYSLVSEQDGSGTLAKNEYGDDYIFDMYDDGALPKAFATNPSAFDSITFDASIKVKTISKTNAAIMLYAMDSAYGNWKEEATYGGLEAGKTYTLSLNLKSYSSLGKLGIRVAGKENVKGATITYTINYAKVVTTGTASSSSSSSTGTGSSRLKYNLTGTTASVAFADTPVGKHGALHLANVTGYKAPVIVGEDGTKVNLRGASTHGMHWGAMTPYVNKGAFQSLRDEWGVNTVRLVSYVTQDGYTMGSKDKLDTAIQNGVKYTKELGMYAIVDWHIHAENPWNTINDAKTFFTKYATMYKDYDNVIFEICNEPTGVQWYTGGEDLYSYCKTIAKVIRDCGSKAIIVCGTNTWSQDVDEVIGHELKDDGFKDIMYTLHFYSATHKSSLRDKATKAYNAGVPIFVTEFGTCDASGGSPYDFDSADEWINFLDGYGIPYCNWSLCNKDEAASMLSTGCSKKTGGWTNADLSESGAWLVNTYRAHQDAENGTDTKGAETTEASSDATTEVVSADATTEAASSDATTEVASSNATTEVPSADATTTEAASTTESSAPTTEASTTSNPGDPSNPSVTPTTEANAAEDIASAPMNTTYKVYYKYKGKLKKMPKKLKITNKKVRKIVIRDLNKKKTKKVTIKVSKKKILKITSKGVIKPKKAGTAKVTVIFADGTKKNFKIKITKKAVK